MSLTTLKLATKKKDLCLRAVKGHFATSHSHMNYYIDITMQKSRLSEAKSIAHEIVSSYRSNTIVDTVLCLDGTEVIGTCIADELTKEDFANMNAHQTIYIVTPEYTSGSQILFRDNVVPMIASKHVLIFAASVTTGLTAKAAAEAVRYYGARLPAYPRYSQRSIRARDIPSFRFLIRRTYRITKHLTPTSALTASVRRK